MYIQSLRVNTLLCSGIYIHVYTESQSQYITYAHEGLSSTSHTASPPGPASDGV